MHRTWLLIVTAGIEAAIGLLLLCVPAIPLRLLLGSESAGPEAILVARIAGAAILAIGIACWLARSDQNSPAQRGVIAGALIYNVTVAALLAYAGAILKMAGIILWPGVLLHAAMAVWCLTCLRSK